jgi:hypothetical protein
MSAAIWLTVSYGRRQIAQAAQGAMDDPAGDFGLFGHSGSEILSSAQRSLVLSEREHGARAYLAIPSVARVGAPNNRRRDTHCFGSEPARKCGTRSWNPAHLALREPLRPDSPLHYLVPEGFEQLIRTVHAETPGGARDCQWFPNALHSREIGRRNDSLYVCRPVKKRSRFLTGASQLFRYATPNTQQTAPARRSRVVTGDRRLQT